MEKKTLSFSSCIPLYKGKNNSRVLSTPPSIIRPTGISKFWTKQPDLLKLMENLDWQGFIEALNGSCDPNRVYGAPYYGSLLHIACRKNYPLKYVRAILEAGADPTYVSWMWGERTAIHFAAREGNAAALRELLFASDRKGAVADVNAIDSKGFTALHEVCNRPMNDKTMECLELLLSRPDIILPKDGITAISMVDVISKWQYIRKNLKQHGAVHHY